MDSRYVGWVIAVFSQAAAFLAAALAVILALVVTPLAAEKANPCLSERDDAYLNRQAEALLAQVNDTLNKMPPQLPEPPERRLALLLLDAVLHDVHSPNRLAVQSFHRARIERAVEEMKHTRVGEGAVLWKLYNHGFVVRTPTVTLAFDLYRGPTGFRVDGPEKGQTLVSCPAFPLREELASRLAQQCDVLFVSHQHADHADEWIAKAFLRQGKPVVAPPDVFGGTAIQGQITHLKREAHALQRLPIQKGTRELRVIVYPGQQYQRRGTPNNVVLVFTPEGMSFAHNGDQINDPYPEYQEDYKWIDKVREYHRVDVLMTNCWLNDIYRFTRGFNPRLVIPGHENELGHPMFDRVPYWRDEEHLQLTYPRLLASDYPVLVMTWGESYHYRPQAR